MQTHTIHLSTEQLEYLLGAFYTYHTCSPLQTFHDDLISQNVLRHKLQTSLIQPDGVGRSPVQSSGAVDQVTTQHDSKCTCDECTCMGFGFGTAPNEGSEHYPFVVGE